MYYETLHEAVTAGLALKLPKGVKLDVDPVDVTWEAMSYETSQFRKYPVARMTIGEDMGRVPLKRCIFVSIYRMPSGRYETTSYLT